MGSNSVLVSKQLYALYFVLPTCHISPEQSGWDRGRSIWRIWVWKHLIRKQTLCLQKAGGNFLLFLKWKMTH